MFKTKEEVIIIQAEAKEPIATRAVFWSHDKGTAKMLFKLRKDGTSQSLAEGTIVPVLLKFNSETAEGGIGRHIYHAVIEDAVNGIVSIVLEDNILGYQGRVDGSIYIELPDSRSLDTAGRFTFHIKRSPIDEDVPELEDYYWQGFGEIMEQYHESIAEIKLEAKTTLDSLTADVNTAQNKVTMLEQSINTANTNLNARIEEINKKIDDNDVFTKAESSANVIDNIASSEIATLKKVFLIDGLGGNAYRESDSGLVDCSANDYTALISDASYIRTEFATAGKVAGFEFYFNVLDVLEKKYTFFKHLNTTAEKVALLKTYVKKHNCTAVLRGGNGSNNGARLALGLNGIANWAGASGWVTSTDFKSNTQNASTTSLLSATGVARFRAYSHTYASDGLTPAWVEVKDISLTVELEVDGRTIIESMIAQNHVDNLATQTEATTATDNTKTMTPLRTKQLLDSKLLNMVYPIGSIYMSVNSATPATLFGGTWERFSKGQVLVGVNEDDTDFTSGKTGGEKKHTLQITNDKTTNEVGFTTAFREGLSGYGLSQVGTFANRPGLVLDSATSYSAAPHNNLQPYISVYMWKRTA